LLVLSKLEGSWGCERRDSDLFIDHFLEAKVFFLVQLIWAYAGALVEGQHIRNNSPSKKSIHVEDEIEKRASNDRL
jgi:hypothetical protein